MRIALTTDTPGFFADIADVLRVFWGEAQVLPADHPDAARADAALIHTHAERAGCWTEHCLWRADGHAHQRDDTMEAMEGPLVRKRFLKRAVKLCCYALMKDVTGLHPPWGALTGIRPTRLYYEQLDLGLTCAQAEHALSEIFDLAPDKAALLGEVVRSQQGLMTREEDAVDVYVGIPFCTTRCAYCSFSSGEIGDGRQVAPYLQALSTEIAAARALVAQAGLHVRAVYVGGGTPTALSHADLEGVMTALAEAFPAAKEWTVEAGRPDTLDADKLRMLRGYPVTRISINPQTMHDATLLRIGRAHTAAQTEDTYALARNVGFANINMDLICALPGEREEDFAQTLAWAARLAPQSLTVHTLALKRASKLRQSAYTPIDAAVVQRMVDMGHRAALAMGMRAYYLYRQKYMAGNLENVGYALPGLACRYNIDIMEETTSVLALGTGAISKRVFQADTRIERAPNVSDLGHYIARVDEMVARKRALWQLPAAGKGDSSR
ncbi:MAG: coproporphyrinogen dehydrogenase HemZ [Oscillospiraceae bacterium]|nr:coproporphyrinogen dehydrogenase HemZ [Oscillospiraceae bacterium]